MKHLLTYILAIISIAIISVALGIVGPWWTMLIPCTIMPLAFPKETYTKAFMISFVSLFLLWGGMALYIDINNHGILSKNIAPLLFIQEQLGFILPLLSAIVGGTVGGVASLLGVSIKRTLQ